MGMFNKSQLDLVLPVIPAVFILTSISSILSFSDLILQDLLPFAVTGLQQVLFGGDFSLLLAGVLVVLVMVSVLS